MQLENKTIVELLTAVVDQNTQLLAALEKSHQDYRDQNQIILELVQENNDLLNRESDEDHKHSGNLDD